MTNFIFYDFETTGLALGFDQVLQVGAIACDRELTERPGARLNERCRLEPHIVPSPTALWITQVHPRQLQEPNLSHLELMARFEEWAARYTPAVFIGHNSLGFDESMMRHARFQSLMDPYLTNKNGNGRGDTMRFARAVYLFRPEDMTFPMLETGRPTFKLGAFCRANGIDFEESEAHDALFDVDKTVELARAVRDRSPAIWEPMLENCTKQQAQNFMQSELYFAAGHVDRYNTEHRWIGTYCGFFQAEAAVFDLKFDPDDFAGMSVEDLAQQVGHEDALPIKSMRLNAQPYAVPMSAPSAEYFERIPDVPEEERTRRAKRLKKDRGLCQRIVQALSTAKEEREPSPYVEDWLYDGFIPRGDEPLMARFKEAPPEERAELIGQFEDKRLASFARRQVYFHSPHALSAPALGKLDAWRRERMISEAADVPWMTIPKARAELAELRATEGDQPLFDEIESYLDEKERALDE